MSIKYAVNNPITNRAREYAQRIAAQHDLPHGAEDAIISTIANILSDAARVQREQEQEIAKLRHELMRAEENARIVVNVAEFWKKKAGG